MLSDNTRTIIRVDEHARNCQLCDQCTNWDFGPLLAHYMIVHDMNEHHRALEYTRKTIDGYSRTVYFISKEYLSVTTHNDDYDRAMKGID